MPHRAGTYAPVIMEHSYFVTSALMQVQLFGPATAAVVTRSGHPGEVETGRHPSGAVFVAVDVHYLASGGARAAAVVAANAAFSRLAANPPITDTCALAADQSQSLSVIGTRTRRVPYRLRAAGLGLPRRGGLAERRLSVITPFRAQRIWVRRTLPG